MKDLLNLIDQEKVDIFLVSTAAYAYLAEKLDALLLIAYCSLALMSLSMSGELEPAFQFCLFTFSFASLHVQLVKISWILGLIALILALFLVYYWDFDDPTSPRGILPLSAHEVLTT